MQLLPAPHSEPERERKSESLNALLSLFDFFFYVSRYSRVRRVVFASFQLCLSDKISFFLILLPLFLTLTLFLTGWLCVNHGPFPFSDLLLSARATTASCVLSRVCACVYSLILSLV